MKATRWYQVWDMGDGYEYHDMKPFVGGLSWREKRQYEQVIGKNVIYYLQYHGGRNVTAKQLATAHWKSEKNGYILPIRLD